MVCPLQTPDRRSPFFGRKNRRRPQVFYSDYLLLHAIGERIATQLGELVDAGMKVLDLGCGDSPYRDDVAARGGLYIGANVSPSSGAAVVVEAERGLPFASDSIDGTIHTCVLEHTNSPFGFLEEIRRILVPGGWMMFVTHGVFPYHGTPGGAYGDFWRWTHEGLEILLASGWESVRVSPTENDWSTLVGLLVLRLRAVTSRSFLPLLGPVVVMLNLFGRVLQCGGIKRFQWFPSCYLVVCKKSHSHA